MKVHPEEKPFKYMTIPFDSNKKEDNSVLKMTIKEARDLMPWLDQ